MKTMILAACLINLVAPGLAQASPSECHARQENHAAARDVDDRIGRTIGAVTSAEARGLVAHGRANELRNELDQMRADYMQNKRAQGFVSAGELASYSRSLDQMDMEIGKE
ncbi:hypothetical protein [Paracoccus sp. (in: a-proteobacteria)]|uniref:hypothetical protein n=1 Tax=Paracoccus sp. TaxID=267 RepID=UPI00396CBFCF